MPKAPCGHDGEAIIGSYVKCLKGCDGGGYHMSGTELPGHVSKCDCAECRLRRRVNILVLRSSAGTDATVGLWDGRVCALDTIQGLVSIKHWEARDAEGKTVAKGPVPGSMVYGTGSKLLLQVDSFTEQRVTIASALSTARVMDLLGSIAMKLEDQILVSGLKGDALTKKAEGWLNYYFTLYQKKIWWQVDVMYLQVTLGMDVCQYRLTVPASVYKAA